MASVWLERAGCRANSAPLLCQNGSLCLPDLSHCRSTIPAPAGAADAAPGGDFGHFSAGHVTSATCRRKPGEGARAHRRAHPMARILPTLPLRLRYRRQAGRPCCELVGLSGRHWQASEFAYNNRMELAIYLSCLGGLGSVLTAALPRTREGKYASFARLPTLF